MQRWRIAALAGVPLVLLVGSTVVLNPTAGAAPPNAPVAAATSTCHAPSSEKVLTVEEGIALVKECSAAKTTAALQWRWMGNYGSVYDVTAVANSAGVGPGALIAIPSPSGLIPAFMYY